MGGYRAFDHTADVGIQATGKDLAEAFANAARGMFSVITNVEAIRAKETRRVEVTAPDVEALLVNWLNELLYLFDTEQFLFAGCQMQALSDTELVAMCLGESVDPRRHPMRTGVKAATYHGLQVRRGRVCRVKVVLDI